MLKEPLLSNALELNLPYPITISKWYANHGTQKFISKEGVAYKKSVAAALQPHLQHCSKHFHTGRLALFVTVPYIDKRKRDLDNLSKCLQDSLVDAGAMDDDSQIDLTLWVRGKHITDNYISVGIYQLKWV